VVKFARNWIKDRDRISEERFKKMFCIWSTRKRYVGRAHKRWTIPRTCL